MNDRVTREEFASGMRYEEITRKCFCCGRMIPHEPLLRETLGEERMFCSEDCVEVFRTYRLPYVDG